jgi:superoxide reductase
MKVYVCKICGYLEFNEIPEQCPVCHADKTNFSQKDNIFKESQEKSPEAEVKHVPTIQINQKCNLIPEQACTDIIVRIGKTLHPSEEKHFIQFIDCYHNEKYVGRAQLSPGLSPAACFHLKNDSGKITVVENCNIHGYWKTDTSL